MKVESVLGEKFSAEFARCNHSEVEFAEYSSVLDAVNSGQARSVEGGLHTIAGHVPGRVIKTNLTAHYNALIGAARGIAAGDFNQQTTGMLLAGSQFRSARNLVKIGSRPQIDQIRGIYEAALEGGERGADFAHWMRVTTLAGIREVEKEEAGKFLKELLALPAVQQEVNRKAPSQTREGLLVAAPALLHPLLLSCYQMSLLYGGPGEQGLALLSIKEIPAKLKDTTTPPKMRTVLSEWGKEYSQVLCSLLDRGLREIKAPNGERWDEEQLAKLASVLLG